MDATALTVVSQLITDARTRFGADQVATLAVDPELLDRAMDQVLSLGGEVGLDHCVVDGVTIRERPDDVEVPVVHLRSDDEPRLLTPLEG